jgi:hypothetical protein
MAATSSTTSTSGGLASSLNVAGSVVEMGTAIANTIAGISDMNKRRRFEEALGQLTTQQQKELNEKLLRVNSQTDRMAIMSESVVQYAIANENSIARKDIALYIIAGSLALVVLVGAIIFKIKAKKQ